MIGYRSEFSHPETLRSEERLLVRLYLQSSEETPYTCLPETVQPSPPGFVSSSPRAHTHSGLGPGEPSKESYVRDTEALNSDLIRRLGRVARPCGWSLSLRTQEE